MVENCGVDDGIENAVIFHETEELMRQLMSLFKN